MSACRTRRSTVLRCRRWAEPNCPPPSFGRRRLCLGPGTSQRWLNADFTRTETAMLPKNVLGEVSASSRLAEGHDTTRRVMLLAMLAAGLPLAASTRAAKASKLDPAETVITLPDAHQVRGLERCSGAQRRNGGALRRPRHAGTLSRVDEVVSRLHERAADRLSLVLSGTWWVNSGADFDPNQTVPVPAGGFVRRVARTPHYDGVKRDAKEPAVIALFGIAPVDLTLVDPSKPGWRRSDRSLLGGPWRFSCPPPYPNKPSKSATGCNSSEAPRQASRPPRKGEAAGL